MTTPDEYRCKKCSSMFASVSHHTDHVTVTCRSCRDVMIVPLIEKRTRTVHERPAVVEPPTEPNRADFTLDHLNMITAPRNWYSAFGQYLRPDHAGFVCAYITADKLSVRFPANPHNIDILLKNGIATRHLRGALGRRFIISLMYRLQDMSFRREQFEKAERLKLAQGQETFALMGYEWKEPAAAWVNVHTCDGREFYYQQRVGIELCLSVKRALLAYEQRTGKTPLMLGVVQELQDLDEIDAVFVIAPRRLLHTAWADEIDAYDPTNRRIVMNSDATRVEAVKFDHNWYLSSFESAAQNWAVLRKLHDPKRIVVIGDETVKIKNPSAKRTLGFMMISRECEYLYELSGAPISRLHEDIWAQAFCVDPGVLGDNIDAFAQSFFEEGRAGKTVFRRHRKMLFHELSDLYMLRCTRGEAEQFTGRDTYTINVRLKMTPAQAKVYRSMLAAYMAVLETEDGAELENEAQNVLVQLLRLREICSGFFSFETTPGKFARCRIPQNPKVRWLRGFIDDRPGQQAIIFCEFNEGEAIVADLLDELGVTWGGTLAVDRARYRRGSKDEEFASQVSEFQSGERQFFLGKHSSIGHGLTLSAADAAIFWNLGFNSDNYDQARMRPVAGGKCALIYHLMMAGSLETDHIYPTLRGRGDMKATVLKDAARKGYYSFFDAMSKSSLQIAAGTEYENDPLEGEARLITGYKGELLLSEIQKWLRGDNPLLSRLDMIRSAGSVANAYRRIASIFGRHARREHNIEDGKLTTYETEAGIIQRLAEQATEDKPDWEEFISEVASTLKLKTDGRTDRSKMFDLMLAYLRMKSEDDITEAS